MLPSHYAGSVCGRALSANPFSSIGFERTQNAMLAYDDADAFATALLEDTPPRPAEQEAIVAHNRRGTRSRPAVSTTPTLGLRANAAQFALLVALNALVGGMVGLERSVLPLVGEHDFKLTRPRPSSPSSSPSASPRRSRTSQPARSPTASGASGCWCSAGWSRCPCRC